jgi:hypothetical protein
MKRGSDLVIILLLVSLLSIGLSSAASCRIAPLNGAGNCTNPTNGPGERIVMGLSDITNAHGQVWNASAYGQSSYPYVLCCDFYAGLGSSPYACSSTLNPATGQPVNKIIGLSDVTNAHSETPNLILYKTNVCFGSLQCTASIAGCSGDYNISVLNLSSLTNAHIGTGAGFNVSICCKDTSTAIGKNCLMNGATWEYQSTLEGGQVKMIAQGTGCPTGTSVNYSVWKQGVLSNTIVNSYIDYFNNLTWVAKLPSGTTGVTNFVFQAQAIISRSSFLSSAGTGNKTLSVSPQPLGFCNGISLCSDYKDQQNCSSDSTLCSPARATFDPNCNPINKQSCKCIWNTATGKCSLSTSYSATTQSCNNGFNLCYNLSMGMYYCYPAGTCPVGDEIQPKGVCDINSGCYSIDCTGTNKNASCAGGATCSTGGICTLAGQAPKNVSSCDSGYTLCYKNGLDFCYPTINGLTGCRIGENPVSNNNSICDPGDGCSSSDCGGLTGGSPSMTDSCSVGAYCYHGACFSPNAGIGTCLLSATTTNCTDGQRTMHTTPTWVGIGNAPVSCQNSSHPDRIIPCAAQIELPFFGTYQVAGAIVLLIIIYLLYAFRKKIFKKKHHSRKRK